MAATQFRRSPRAVARFFASVSGRSPHRPPPPPAGGGLVVPPQSSPSTLRQQRWVEVSDGSSQYWWCETTDQTTTLGASEPLAWEEAIDEATGGRYWWSEETNETTAVGEPCPQWDREEGLQVQQSPFLLQQQQQQDQHALQEAPPSFAKQMGSMAVLGGGVAVGSIVVSVAWRMLFGG